MRCCRPRQRRSKRTRALSLKARALQWLAQRDHSRAELRRKLLHRLEAEIGADADAEESTAENCQAKVDELLDWLAANRYLDEHRFVESRVHARVARFGNRRIESELARHGVALDSASSDALRASELARAREVWGKRFGVLPANATERARQMRFLAGRGFSTAVISRVMRGDEDGLT